MLQRRVIESSRLNIVHFVLNPDEMTRRKVLKSRQLNCKSIIFSKLAASWHYQLVRPATVPVSLSFPSIHRNLLTTTCSSPLKHAVKPGS